MSTYLRLTHAATETDTHTRAWTACAHVVPTASRRKSINKPFIFPRSKAQTDQAEFQSVPQRKTSGLIELVVFTDHSINSSQQNHSRCMSLTCDRSSTIKQRHTCKEIRTRRRPARTNIPTASCPYLLQTHVTDH